MTASLFISMLVVQAGLVSAVVPVASVCSTGILTIAGVTVGLGGVVCWPAFAGDAIATTSSAAVFLLLDGSRVVMGKNSRLRLEHRERKSILHVLDGAVYVTLSKNSELTVMALDQPLVLDAEKRGSIRIERSRFVFTPGGAAPTLDFDPLQLMRRLPYALGPILPSEAQ